MVIFRNVKVILWVASFELLVLYINFKKGLLGLILYNFFCLNPNLFLHVLAQKFKISTLCHRLVFAEVWLHGDHCSDLRTLYLKCVPWHCQWLLVTVCSHWYGGTFYKQICFLKHKYKAQNWVILSRWFPLLSQTYFIFKSINNFLGVSWTSYFKSLSEFLGSPYSPSFPGQSTD